MNKNDEWKIGYMLGQYDGDNRTLLDCNLNYIPKLNIDGREFTVYDVQDDLDKRLNFSINL